MPPETMAQNVGKSKNPPGDSTRITKGLGGYTHRIRSRTPVGKSKIAQIKLLTSYRERSRLSTTRLHDMTFQGIHIDPQ